mmetsp:Transcript_21276/g.58452  ORF Transcript_21276/g.58452 Transcript_21276/m.58452 type:complete len:354 (+) Transcript_21276:3568-4629(+)|eukprot:scaffold284363_cov32-Tisochrysis_lutea.AAC.7
MCTEPPRRARPPPRSQAEQDLKVLWEMCTSPISRNRPPPRSSASHSLISTSCRARLEPPSQIPPPLTPALQREMTLLRKYAEASSRARAPPSRPATLETTRTVSSNNWEPSAAKMPPPPSPHSQPLSSEPLTTARTSPKSARQPASRSDVQLWNALPSARNEPPFKKMAPPSMAVQSEMVEAATCTTLPCAEMPPPRAFGMIRPAPGVLPRPSATQCDRCVALRVSRQPSSTRMQPPPWKSLVQRAKPRVRLTWCSARCPPCETTNARERPSASMVAPLPAAERVRLKPSMMIGSPSNGSSAPSSSWTLSELTRSAVRALAVATSCRSSATERTTIRPDATVSAASAAHPILT